MVRKKDHEEMRTLFAEEQVLLSKERTILSFMRTGLAFIVVGLAIVNLFNNLPAQIVGWILVVIGFGEVFESFRRLYKYKKRMDEIKEKKVKIEG